MTGWYFIKHYQIINICRIIEIKASISLFALHLYKESHNNSQYLKKDICVSDTMEVNFNDS